MAKRSNKKLRRRLNKKVLLVILLVILAAGTVYAWQKKNDSTNKAASTKSSHSSTKPTINLSPPTPQEKKDTEDYKQSLSNPPAPQPTTTNGKIQVTPTITSADYGEVRALVTGIFEDGGTCTSTATKNGSAPVSGTSSGIGSSNYTTCPPIHLNLGPGTWSLTVSYSSAKAEGKSESKNITIK